MQNKMTVRFSALSQNESFARVCAGVFASQLCPTMSQLADIKTAVSEAVTNAIIHAYRDGEGDVELRAALNGDTIEIEVADTGVGIPDVKQALAPFYTTCAGDDRSGMGFTVMETFMDTLEVTSAAGRGTVVRMTKRIGREGLDSGQRYAKAEATVATISQSDDDCVEADLNAICAAQGARAGHES